MKLAVCLVVLVGTIVMVCAEDCQHPDDCSHVTCPENDYTIDCVHHQCTCVHSEYHNNNECPQSDDIFSKTCIDSASCSTSNPCQDDNCHRGLHCIDGSCHCGWGMWGGGGIGK